MILTTLMRLCIDALGNIGFKDAVEHKFGEFAQKVLAAELHQGVAECHAVASHPAKFTPRPKTLPKIVVGP